LSGSQISRREGWELEPSKRKPIPKFGGGKLPTLTFSPAKKAHRQSAEKHELASGREKKKE